MRRVLIHKLDHIGDTLLATPAIRALRRSFPGAELSALVTPLTQPVLDGNPDLNELILFDPEGLHKGRKTVAAFAAGLRDRHFDLIVCFSAAVRDYRLVKRFGGGERVAPVYRRMWASRVTSLFTLSRRVLIQDDPGDYLANPFPLRHEVEQNLEVVKAVGVLPPDDPRLILPVPEEEEAAARERMKTLPFPTRTSRIIGVQLSKRWFWPTLQVAGMVNLLETLVKFYPTGYFLLFHHPADSPLAREIRERVPPRNNVEFLPPVPLKRYAALLKQCHAVVTMHSGTTHVAAAVGVPAVVVFPHKWFDYFSIREAPWKVPHEIVKRPWDPPLPRDLDSSKLGSAMGLHSREVVDRLQRLLVNQQDSG